MFYSVEILQTQLIVDQLFGIFYVDFIEPSSLMTACVYLEPFL